jgi:tRNA U34 2-thiouridine synthase MnmA/TrmU
MQILDITEDYLDIVTNPEFGYGRNLNPCIDCKIMMLRKAGEEMQKIGAHFVITGEVLGQRPMSQQRSTLNLIEKRSGLQGLIVRPLSAKLLKPTTPESEGWINRTKLFDFSGRTRKPQIALADKLGIKSYAQPAGGCFLTDENYARRIKDLIRYKQKEKITLEEIQLALCGRQFRISDTAKAIVGRDENDNKILSQFMPGRWALKAVDFEGPLTIVECSATEKELEIAAQLTARYCDGKFHEKVLILAKQGDEKRDYYVNPITSGELERMRI